jgi:hypothetical protein
VPDSVGFDSGVDLNVCAHEATKSIKNNEITLSTLIDDTSCLFVFFESRLGQSPFCVKCNAKHSLIHIILTRAIITVN